jgi:CHAT domain-containing protein/uncharacterized protein HemY
VTILPARPRALLPALRHALGLAGALGALQLACAPPPPARLAPAAAETSPAAGPAVLRLGETIERELSGGGQDELLLNLEAGWYVRVVIDQKRLNVKAALLGPGGETLLAVDGPAGWTDPEQLSLITPSEGEYRLVVGLHDPKATAGVYKVNLEELRPALPQDADRVSAERALSEIKLLRADGQAEARGKALARAGEVLPLWRKIGDRQGEIDILFEVGLLEQSGQRIPDAIATLAEARRLSIAARDRRREAFAARYLGECQLGRDAKEALRSFEDALAIWTELGDVSEQAEVWQAIGASYSHQSLNDEARSAFQKVLDLARKAKSPVLEASAWNAIATIYLNEGEGQKALDHAENALRLAEETDSPGVKAAALTTMGSVYRRWGELLSAQKHFSEALAINRRLGKSADVGKVLSHLGTIYQDLGELERALAVYGEALMAHRSAGDKRWEALTRLSIGQVHLKLRDPQTALASFESALGISLGQNDRDAGLALHSVGVARLALGQTAEALEALESALLLRRKAYDRHGEASTLVELGGTYQKQGTLERAEPFLREGLDLARRINASFVEASARFGLARLHRDRGDLEGALGEIEQAIQSLESIRSDLPDDRSRSSFFASKRSYYDFYIDLLMRLDGRSPGGGYAARALQASEKARARSLLDLLAQGRLVTRGISPDLLAEEAELARRLSQAQRNLLLALSQKEPDGAKVERLRADVTRTEEERRDLTWKISQEHPRYAQVRYPSPLGLSEIQALLDGETALLEYSLGEEGSYLFVVTREVLRVLHLPPAEEIRERVQEVRDGLVTTDRRSWPRYTRAAHRLYGDLIAPALPALEGKGRLLIAPDGALHFLAFEALLTEPADGRRAALLPYLLAKFAVSYVPSVSVLSLLDGPDSPVEAGGEPPKKLVAFADPVYGPDQEPEGEAPSARGGEEGRGLFDGLRRLPRLQGTSEEVSRIVSRYQPSEVKIYRGEEANEQNVKNNPLVESARRLHLAAHGLVDERQPELSGLSLTPTGQGDDGLLQVYEIFNLSLRADLVVLSACDTGLGKLVNGEGLVGLTRAFLYAGAPSVVVSLWRVRDDTVPELMVGFYEGLERLDKAEALRQAKLAMIRKGENAHPYHWAPFILVGNPR